MGRASRRHLLQGGLALAGLGLLSGCGLVPGLARRAQSTHRVGWLSIGRVSGGPDPNLESFRQGFGDLGYADGRDVTLEVRSAEPRDLERQLPSYAREVAGLAPEVIVAGDLPSAAAVKEVTDEIPIVVVAPIAPSVSENVRGLGPLVAGLARPGSNVTGLIGSVEGLWSKRLEFLRDCIPGAKRIGVLWNTRTAGPFSRFESGFIDAGPPIGPSLGIELLPLEMPTPDDVELAFEVARNAGVDGLACFATVYITSDLRRVAALALGHRLPSIADNRAYVAGGGLLAYATDTSSMYRRAAAYVDKILHGDRPENLPVEQPSKFDLLLNLKTAQAIGVTIPQSVLLQATEVIQ